MTKPEWRMTNAREKWWGGEPVDQCIRGTVDRWSMECVELTRCLEAQRAE